MKPLTHKQLASLAIAARHAYDCLAADGTVRCDFAQWRRNLTRVHTGKFSWRNCTQSDYIPLYNAFAGILGRPTAVATTARTEKSKQLVWCIRTTASEAGINNAYLARLIGGKTSRPWISREMTVEEMCKGIAPTTLRHILYTLQARARKINNRQLNKWIQDKNIETD